MRSKAGLKVSFFCRILDIRYVSYNVTVSSPILTTKLYIPPLPPKVVVRSRLLERLDERVSEGRKLSPHSAPAGFWQTALVSQWLAGGERPAAWLSPDEGDSDPTRLLIYLVSALQTIAP